MNYFIAIFIFCVVLFLYLHIYYHLKTSNDLEVYTIEKPSKDKLEEICDLRQPVIFDYNYEELEIGFNARYLLDIASQIDGSNILFALEGSGSPALIADSDDSQATYVLMPMRV